MLTIRARFQQKLHRARIDVSCRASRRYRPPLPGAAPGLPVANAKPLGAELDAFMRVIRDGSTPVISAIDGLWAVAIASGLLQAGRDGRPVDLTTLSERLSSG